VNALDLKRLTLLAELEDDERQAVAEQLEPLDLEPRTLIFDEGEQGEGLVFIAEGSVRVESFRAQRGVELGPGASLGAFSLVASGPREVRAETTSRTRILVLRRSSFRRFADAEPRAACRLLEAILRETSRMGRQMVARATAGDVDPMGRGD